MIFKVLAVGDVCAQGGLDYLGRKLRQAKRETGAHFVVVNGENASGVGILPQQAEDIFDAGADVITLGNHTWNRIQIAEYLDDSPYILRPANYASAVPGRGCGVYEGPNGLSVAVINLMGRCELDCNLDSPFAVADEILDNVQADVVLVDFHAEATSEKGALGWYLDGRVQVLWGTHTHVPTADGKILPKGTGFITDLGMTGPINSVLGIRPQQSINRFLGGLPSRYEGANGPCKMDSVLFSVDTESGCCVGVERVDFQGNEGGKL